MPLRPYLDRAASRANLSAEEARQAMHALLAGEETHEEIAAFLLALRDKGETAEELAGFARAMREHMIGVDAAGAIDNCGTGGDGSGTFNVSTVAALVMAGAGAKVAKHGNRSISSATGGADVLETLGVRIAVSPEEASRCLHEAGFAFLFAPAFHPAMKHVQPVRRQLKIRTVFNLLGPLCNPARTLMQVIGAPTPAAGGLIAQALLELGTRRSFVVHGRDGLDEISTTTETDVYEVTATGIAKHVWSPEDFGVSRADPAALKGGDAKENAAIAEAILRGESGPKRDIVMVNAAAGLVAAGLANGLQEGMTAAHLSLDSGAALQRLQTLRRLCPA